MNCQKCKYYCIVGSLHEIRCKKRLWKDTKNQDVVIHLSRSDYRVKGDTILEWIPRGKKLYWRGNECKSFVPMD